jgi:hypothetical protein
MRIGQKVLLIGREDEMPPLGSIGEVMGYCPSGDGDIDVDFPDFPNTITPNDPGWCCAPWWLVPLDPDRMQQRDETREVIA